MVRPVYLVALFRFDSASREEAGFLRETRGAHIQAVQRRNKPKFKAEAYVVFVGREPAVYTVWYDFASTL